MENTLKYAGAIVVLAACFMLLAKTINNNTAAQYRTSNQIKEVALEIHALTTAIEAQRRIPTKKKSTE